MNKNIAVEWSSKKLELVDYKKLKNRYFVRTTAEKSAIEEVFGKVEYVVAEDMSGENGFVTEGMSEGAYAQKAEALGNIRQMIRVI